MKPYYFRKHKPAKVTILAGFKCENAIVLASDSQTTEASSKRCDTTKISEVKFECGTQALVAESGSVALSGHFLEMFQKLAASRNVSDGDYRAIADCAQEAIPLTREVMRRAQGNCTQEELNQFIRGTTGTFNVMLAYYFENDPYLFTVDFETGIATKENSFYSVAGCAANLAQYLISEYCEPKMHSRTATAWAYYIVEKAIQHDAFCGYPVRIASLRKPFPPEAAKNAAQFPLLQSAIQDNVFVVEPESMEKIAELIRGLDDKHKSDRVKDFKKAMEDLSKQEYFKKVAGKVSSLVKDYYVLDKHLKRD